MTKKLSLEHNLAQLKEIRENPTSDPAIEELRRALESKSNHLAAEAARIAGEYEIEQLEDDLLQAFDRFMLDPLRSDPTCAAKTAIAEAISRIGYVGEDLFLRGIRHRQLEPVYGGKEDTAVGLRVACAMGLVGTSYPDSMVELAILLADREPDARMGAVRAIGEARQMASVPLLRFKALIGDDAVHVMFECFSALLMLAPEPSLPFVAGYLDDENPAIREAAIIAMGKSRLPGVIDILSTEWERELDPALRRATLQSIAMLRDGQAMDFLLSLVEDAPPNSAMEAVAALEIYRQDERLWQQVERIAEARGDLEFG